MLGLSQSTHTHPPDAPDVVSALSNSITTSVSVMLSSLIKLLLPKNLACPKNLVPTKVLPVLFIPPLVKITPGYEK